MRTRIVSALSALRTRAPPVSRSRMVTTDAAAALPRREPLLFTPGPLTTSPTVKQAMLTDLGSRDGRMVEAVREVRNRLLGMAHVSQDAGYECVIVQGSGTFAVESVISSVVAGPAEGGRLLVLSNGAYGERIKSIAERSGIDYHIERFGETEAVCPEAAARILSQEQGGSRPFTHVAVIHHETTAGVLNPIRDIGAAVRKHAPGAAYIVDSMSAFGAYEVDMVEDCVDYMVSSANKNIEGVPGFAFAVCNRERLESEGRNARTISLDLLEQWRGLEGNGQFRFTPPTHALLAFRQALDEHELEGGPEGRLARYTRNCDVLTAGMASMGFSQYVDETHRGSIISTFLFPDDPKFDFGMFYEKLGDAGYVIYPGKLTAADCFRVGSIGRLYESDIRGMVAAARGILEDMGVSLPVRQ